MDTLTFIASVIESLSWPLAFVAVFILFRRPLIRILNSIKNLKYQDFEIGLEEEILELKESTRQIERHQSDELEEIEELDIDEKIKEIARISPSASISLAWSEVEKEIREAINRTAISPDYPPHNSIVKNLDLLLQNELIKPSTYHLLGELRSIRNKVVHTHPEIVNLDAVAAIDFGNMAKIARRALKQIDRKSNAT
jgi:hypothetical protein